LDVDQQKAFVELLAYVKRLTTVWGEVQLSPEAKAYHKRLYEEGIISKERRNHDPRLDDYYGRKNIHWLKLMIVHHYAEQMESNIITKETVDRAWDTLQRGEAMMHLAYQTSGRNMLHESSVEMMRYLQEHGRTSIRSLMWQFGKDLKKAELQECVEMLISANKIRQNGAELYAIHQPKELYVENGDNTKREDNRVEAHTPDTSASNSNIEEATDTIDLNSVND
jgi:hypothetical protein